MYFFEGLYQWLAQALEGKINHFPLVRLVFYSLDHACLLFLIWFLAWTVYTWLIGPTRGRARNWRRDLARHGFIFYLLLLLQLTVFRSQDQVIFLTIVPHSLRDIHLVPFVDSWKLFFHGSKFAAYYNVFGNILWFVPLGLYMTAYKTSKPNLWPAFWSGLALSLAIESLQFLFFTGVSHIDDVFCNLLGSLLGGCLVLLGRAVRRKS